MNNPPPHMFPGQGPPLSGPPGHSQLPPRPFLPGPPPMQQYAQPFPGMMLPPGVRPPPMQQVLSAPPTGPVGSGVPSAPVVTVSAGPTPTPYIPPHRHINVGPAYYPMILLISNLHPDMSDEYIKKVLECCGPIQKWNRPKDPITDKYKNFALCTFREGTSGLRCKRVLNDMELPVNPPGENDTGSNGTVKIMVRGSSKEEGVLATLAAQERAKFASGANTTVTSTESTETKSTSNEESDVVSQLDAPVREKVYAFLQGKASDDENDNEEKKDVEECTEKAPEPYKLRDGDDGYDREKEIQSEIEQYRWRQAIRDKEVVKERQDRLKRRLRELEEKYQREEAQKRGQDDHKRTRDGKGNIAESSEHKRQRKLEVMELIQQTSDSIPIPQPDSGPLVSTKLVLKGGATSAKAKTNKPTARGGFATAEDDEQDGKKLRAIIPLDYTAEEEAQGHLAALQQMQASSSAAKVNNGTSSSSSASSSKPDQLKALADAIPTTKDELFAYSINWEACDRHNIVEASVRAWVIKKFIEYLGEEEESITNFIVSKLKQHCQPQELLEELVPVLDSDAEPFILKLWRLLAFSILKADMS